MVASAAQADCSGLLAITAAPGSGVEGLAAPWIGDESRIAAEMARRAGVRHLVCRSEVAGLPALLDEVAAFDFQPFNNPANLPWIRQLCIAARNEGAEVIAGGFAGNLTISLGGPAFLADQLRENGVGRWFDVARAVRSSGALSWSQIIARSFGWMIPRQLYSLLRRAWGKQGHARPTLPLLREPFRSAAEAYRRQQIGDLRARPSSRAHFASLIQHIEPGNKYALACWGVDIRDPTADRRLAEICLSLPVEAYVGGDHSRPAFHHAFRDRLAEDVLEGRHAGAQAADWFRTIEPGEVLAGFRRYAHHPVASEMFDLDMVATMIDRWPASAAAADQVHDEYCNQLLGSLAVASFINAHFPA